MSGSHRVVVATVLLAAGASLLHAPFTAQRERPNIRARYELMRAGLAAGVPADVGKLYDPPRKGRIQDGFDDYPTLGARATIVVWGTQAWIFPQGENDCGIELFKIDDEWLFTGTRIVDFSCGPDVDPFESITRLKNLLMSILCRDDQTGSIFSELDSQSECALEP